jgi:hypothetical protein
MMIFLSKDLDQPMSFRTCAGPGIIMHTSKLAEQLYHIYYCLHVWFTSKLCVHR